MNRFDRVFLNHGKRVEDFLVLPVNLLANRF